MRNLALEAPGLGMRDFVKRRLRPHKDDIHIRSFKDERNSETTFCIIKQTAAE